MIELIPAIDLIDGKCVRLTKGDYATQKTYNEDPVAVAREFESYGFKRLHVVDLDGARSKHIVNHKVLERLASATGLTIDFGGGIKADEDLRIAFESGAALVTIGSVAATRPELFLGWLGQYGSDHIILGADVKDGLISINGWKEESTQELLPFLRRYMDEGVRHVLCTDISKDGMLTGPNFEMLEMLQALPGISLIASGGVSSPENLKKLQDMGIYGAICGKALYEGRVTMEDIRKLKE